MKVMKSKVIMTEVYTIERRRERRSKKKSKRGREAQENISINEIR